MTSALPPEPADDAQPSARDALKTAFGDAARGAGIGAVTPGEVPTAKSLLAAVGGVRGLIESILPGLGFLVVYTLTKDLLLSVSVPLVVAVAFVVVRAATKSMVMPAVAGLIGIGVSAVLALMTGRAEDNFLPGLIINVVSLTVLLVSILVRWPLIGLIVGVLTGELTEWRDDRTKRRVLTVATWLWVGLFAARLLVQAPLYFAGEPELLGGAKLIMGVPLYAAMLWVTWLLVRAAFTRPAAEPSVGVSP
ncbi:DUF3159 domain-containing protein [Homoserinimonas hongtaonis]|uniref:DUF3159 domain-containing protein n=1 Tax=Homoserinimonas hongtaonis TaxID=2079791 RepID=UPI001E40ED57|nr:DUF3159 domain-containing protein [Salinibacterium hongtaonis]